jgi:hypothetical protein
MTPNAKFLQDPVFQSGVTACVYTDGHSELGRYALLQTRRRPFCVCVVVLVSVSSATEYDIVFFGDLAFYGS